MKMAEKIDDDDKYSEVMTKEVWVEKLFADSVDEVIEALHMFDDILAREKLVAFESPRFYAILVGWLIRTRIFRKCECPQALFNQTWEICRGSQGQTEH